MSKASMRAKSILVASLIVRKRTRGNTCSGNTRRKNILEGIINPQAVLFFAWMFTRHEPIAFVMVSFWLHVVYHAINLSHHRATCHSTIRQRNYLIMGWSTVSHVSFSTTLRTAPQTSSWPFPFSPHLFLLLWFGDYYWPSELRSQG